MAKRGRPTKSPIRQNIVELLFVKGKAFGYELAKEYNQIFPKCTARVIYYHLKKGATLGEFKIHKIIKEEGNFSWGSTVERIYYELGDKAAPQVSDPVKKFFEKKIPPK
ncbi:hypothetical protein HN695_04265 [Candidatus Woesearchaeota archaeon]|jgi:hypothetical protein|nr:hypothetical protein [Candidatus Woesearchaeota archaeon]MBT5272364.1 hypothetical protein [Candidatus Woesearchaeota archaeon]MBT6040593.1 hypothetical protein [Candidatus Woesearchaeota archaeon]MBT6336636.1 hypothetical protein [Candidatus Woesearchaeota archaeon]MBT7927526.1 hypothetical protein [Candidatus Woesearchaeota archaeon]